MRAKVKSNYSHLPCPSVVFYVLPLSSTGNGCCGQSTALHVHCSFTVTLCPCSTWGDASVLPVVDALTLMPFRMTSANPPPELLSRTVLILKAEGNTCLSAAVITSNLENLKMMHCVIYITVCKNLSPVSAEDTALHIRALT